MSIRNKSACALALVAVVALAACGDDPVEPDGFTTDQLTTELAITPDHVHLYETTVSFTVSVTDPNGDPVTDFELLQVERRLDGDATWSLMEADVSGDFYVVDQVFEESGEYEIRVQGLRPSDDELVLLYEAPEMLEAVAPHADVGGYHVTLEPDPGHIHEGDDADVRFWVADEATETPVTGLGPTIWVEEPDATVTEYDAEEGADGLYHAVHSFTQVGTTVLGIRFIGEDQQEYEWSLEIEVHEAH